MIIRSNYKRIKKKKSIQSKKKKKILLNNLNIIKNNVFENNPLLDCYSKSVV